RLLGRLAGDVARVLRAARHGLGALVEAPAEVLERGAAELGELDLPALLDELVEELRALLFGEGEGPEAGEEDPLSRLLEAACGLGDGFLDGVGGGPGELDGVVGRLLQLALHGGRGHGSGIGLGTWSGGLLVAFAVLGT